MSEPPTLLPKTGDPLTLENRPLESPFSVELPSETWLVVLENLETDHDALRACSLLNNKFNLLSNPLLWRAITLPIYYRGHTEKLWPRLFALLARPERLRSIRKLAVVFHPHEDNPPSEPIDAYIAILNECNRLIRDVVEKYRLNGTLDPVELPWRMVSVRYSRPHMLLCPALSRKKLRML
ncbi:hypothetical protein DL93DRAFT_2077836 [Clavulina sp. PMI_390]|nr:hypothetical protein DL93DRAFT_2077836 [Clavulina sp. PMI_390]